MKRYLWLIACVAFLEAHGVSRASVLEELESAFADVLSRVGPTVVSISTIQTYRLQSGYLVEPFDFPDSALNEFFRKYFVFAPDTELQKYGLGSGIIVRKEGYILTNYHVVQGASGIEVTLQDGRKFSAVVKGKDPRSDLVALKIEASDLPVTPLGDSSGVKPGQWVVAIGNPFGYLLKDTQPTVTVGVVSAVHRKLPEMGLEAGTYYFDLIQTDAAINPGNSGGPLVNLKGEVVGINMAIFLTPGGYQGVGFAIPVDVVKNVVDDLIAGYDVQYGWLGVGVGPIDGRIAKDLNLSDQKGALVLKIFEGSPAEKYQLRELDVIRKLGQVEVKSPEDLIREIAKIKAGVSITVQLIRRGEKIDQNLVLEPYPQKSFGVRS